MTTVRRKVYRHFKGGLYIERARGMDVLPDPTKVVQEDDIVLLRFETCKDAADFAAMVWSSKNIPKRENMVAYQNRAGKWFFRRTAHFDSVVPGLSGTESASDKRFTQVGDIEVVEPTVDDWVGKFRTEGES